MTLSLDQAVDLTRSGDIWLFRGRRAPDRAIRAVTNSPVNHVGMAVVVDDLPPLIFHAELGKKQEDVWTGAHHRGVQLHDLREAVSRWQTNPKPGLHDTATSRSCSTGAQSCSPRP